MSDTEEMVVLPTGEIIPLSGDPAVIAHAWDELTGIERDLKSTKRAIQDEITRRLDFEGRRQMTIDGYRFETTAPTDREWDLPELQTLLLQLVGEGTISEQKADRCIKWEPKVVWNEVKPLLSDPRCAKRMEQTFRVVPANRYAKVTRA